MLWEVYKEQSKAMCTYLALRNEDERKMREQEVNNINYSEKASFFSPSGQSREKGQISISQKPSYINEIRSWKVIIRR